MYSRHFSYTPSTRRRRRRYTPLPNAGFSCFFFVYINLLPFYKSETPRIRKNHDDDNNNSNILYNSYVKRTGGTADQRGAPQRNTQTRTDTNASYAPYKTRTRLTCRRRDTKLIIIRVVTKINTARIVGPYRRAGVANRIVTNRRVRRRP